MFSENSEKALGNSDPLIPLSHHLQTPGLAFFTPNQDFQSFLCQKYAVLQSFD